MSKKNDNFFEKKKDWSITKDSILGSYLVPYLAKLFKYGKPICYIDCFAGKGKFDDGNPGSPAIAIECINSGLVKTHSNKARVNGYFIELNYADELKNNVNLMHPNFKTEIIDGKFEDNIDKILNLHYHDTIFLYIDPYGIKALNVEKFNSFKINREKSVELLINFNTWGFFREACRVLKVDFKLDKETAEYLIEYDPSNNVSREELNIIAGGDYWIKIVQDYKNGIYDNQKAEQELSKGISNVFKKKYQYVLNVPVKTKATNKTPKYRLFHLTNHEDGCLIMAENMHKRINEAAERQRGGQLSIFDLNGEGEIEDLSKVKDNIKSILSNKEIHLHPMLCKYFTNYGIDTQASKIREILIDFEEQGLIEIIRTPALTSKGKKSSFMKEEKGHEVIIRKIR